jgi:hypothetical protein
MWQLHWAVSLIPDNVLVLIYYSMLTLGLVGYIGSKLFKRFPFKYIPFLGQYPLLSEIVGVVLLSVGAFLYGGYATEMAWRDKAKQLEEQIKLAEQQSNNKNVEIQEKIVEKTKVIKGKTEYLTQYIDREIIKKEEIVKYIEQCPVPKEIIDLHNQAVDLNKAAEGPKK